MQPADLFLHLRRFLAPEDASSVLLALKSDNLVWNALYQGDIFQSTVLNGEFDSWSPANLALASLGSRLTAAELSGEHFPVIETGLRKKSLERFEKLLRKGIEADTLADAGLVAIALRERRRKTQTWNGLVDELLSAHDGDLNQCIQTWKTPLACLAGMVSDRQSLCEALISKEHLNPGMEWCTHILLSNPDCLEAQVEQFKNLLLHLPLDFQAEWLRILMRKGRQALASALANELLYENREYVEFLSQDIDPDLASWTELSQKVLGSEVLGTFHQVAGHPIQATAFLEKARLYLHHWVSGASLQLAALAAKDGRLSENSLDDCSSVMNVLPVSENLSSEMYFVGSDPILPVDIQAQSGNKASLLGKVFYAAYRSNTAGKREAQELAREAVQYWLNQVRRDPAGLTGMYVLDYQVRPLIDALVELGLLKDAIEVGKEFLRVRPEDSLLMALVADICHRVGDNCEALDLVYQVILLNPFDLEAQRTLASYLEDGHAWTDAMEIRRQILEMIPLPGLADMLDLARCALGGGFFDEAIDACERAQSLDPDAGLANAYAGMAYAQKGMTDEALANLSKATLLIPENPLPWIQLANLHRKNGDRQRALETLRTAILTAPDSAELHYELGRSYLENKLASEALPFLRQSARLAPESDEVALALTETLLSLGHENEALDVLEKARAKWPAHAGLAFQQARLLLARGDRDEGIATLELALQSDRANPDWFVLYAATLMGKPESQWMHNRPVDFNLLAKAQKALQRSLNAQADHLETRVLMAELLAMRQDLEAAYAAYDQLVQVDMGSNEPFYWRIQAGLGNVARKLGHHSIALASLKNAVGARPDSLVLQRQLAETYENLKLNEFACQTADNALMLAPDAIDNLVWYAGVMERIGEVEKGIDALKTAAQIAPQRVNIVTSLAGLYRAQGNGPACEAALMQVLGMETAAANDLIQAAEIAREIQNPDLTLASLEKAASINPEPSDSLQYDLAVMYGKAGRIELAIQAVQKAIDIQPEEEAYYLLQSDLQEKLKRPQAALASLEHALRLHESKPLGSVDETAQKSMAGSQKKDSALFDIHLRFARMLEKTGNLCSALYHAEKGFELNPHSAEICFIACELAYRLLQPERAESMLNEFAPLDQGESDAGLNEAWMAPLTALAMELAFLRQDDKSAQAIFENGLKTYPADVVLLAGKVRWLAAQDKFSEAEVLYNSTLKQWVEAQNVPVSEKESRGETNIAISTVVIAKAAASIFLWNDAVSLAENYLQVHADEPLAMFAMITTTVMAGEWQMACGNLGVSSHICAKSMLDEETEGRFLQLTGELTKSAGNADLDRWKARGEVLFQPTTAKVRVLEGMHVTDQDIPWIVFGLGRSGNRSAGIQVAAKHSGVAYAQMAAGVVTGESDPAKAIELAKKAVELAPANPVCQMNLSRMAQIAGQTNVALDALEAGLEQWPNEPEWHFEAATLAEACQEHELAIEHLEIANELVPGNKSFLTALGKKYLQFRLAAKATASFAEVTRLVPDEEAGWDLLAQAQYLAGEKNEAQKAAERALEINPKILYGAGIVRRNCFTKR